MIKHSELLTFEKLQFEVSILNVCYFSALDPRKIEKHFSGLDNNIFRIMIHEFFHASAYVSWHTGLCMMQSFPIIYIHKLEGYKWIIIYFGEKVYSVGFQT